MSDLLIDPADLRFLLFDWLKIETLFQRPAFADHSRDTTEALLDLAEQLAADAFLPHYKLADRQEPVLTADGVQALPQIGEAVRAFVEAGFMAAPFSGELGGIGLPYVVHAAAMSQFMAANVAAAAFPMLTIANANLLTTFGSAAQIDAFVRPQIGGGAMGTMCLSEPQAGSSLGDITTRAEPEGEDGLGARYRLFGAKMWISGGDHDVAGDIVHLVLAKVPGPDGRLPAGSKGISLFIAPKHLPDGTRNDVVVAGLNHKMGYRGIPNCLLNFGEGTAHRPDGRAGAVAWRVGQTGAGLAMMFQMMNEARIFVGLGAGALAYRGYRLSSQYARERLQGRAPSGRDPVQGPQPILRHPDVRLMLLAQKAYAEGALALSLYCARLIDERATACSDTAQADCEALLGLLTPVAKTWPSEWGLAANDLAIQVHGGYGYTRDFDVEQLYRDNRLNPIHEGTTGIQALDLLSRKILRSDGSAWRLLSRRIAETDEQAAEDERLAGHALALRSLWATLGEAVEAVEAIGDPTAQAANATGFLRAFGHGIMAWLWLDQAIAAHATKATPTTIGKLAACDYVFAYEVPKIDAWLAPVFADARTGLDIPDDAL